MNVVNTFCRWHGICYIGLFKLLVTRGECLQKACLGVESSIEDEKGENVDENRRTMHTWL